jgi:hypothetical protein
MCAKIVILELVSACVIVMCCKKKGREVPEDGVDKFRNMSELKSDILQKVCIFGK